MFENLKSRYLLLAATALITLAVLAGGCAKQDLYEAPGSPYHREGQVGLPSINEGVAVVGTFAFVAGGEAGLHSVDWSDPTQPQLVATINTTKYADDIAVVRSFAGGVMRDIAHLVEGTEGVTSFDVTDPYAPFDYNTGQTAIVGRTLFIVEAPDPSAPYKVYLADDWKGVRLFDSYPDNPGILNYRLFVETNGKAYAVAVQDGWAYVADNEMGICVLDMRDPQLNDPIVSWADTPGNARAIALWNGHAFIADATEGLAVFSINAGETPVKVAQFDLNGFSEAIQVRDGLCAIAANGAGIHFLDVSEPANPVYLGSQTTSYATDIALADDGHCIVVDEDEGLIVFGGRGPFSDQSAPARVSDLSADPVAVNAVELSWTMTGDDGYYGTAAALEVRWSSDPITDDASWDAATAVPDAPAPEAPGTLMNLTVDGLDRDATYHFAVRITDKEDQTSAVSNPIAATTLDQIALRNGSVSPEAGPGSATFVYEVEVLWGLPLSVAEVVIDGTGYAMAPGEGRFYRYEANDLQGGTHTYSFRFDADTADEALYPAGGGAADGPVVGVVFTMGSPVGENGRHDDEVLHSVALSQDVIGSVYEVTQSEWEAVMDPGTHPNPSQYVGANRPVDSVSWYDAVQYCNARSTEDGMTPAYTIAGTQVTWNRDADGWRLPTEAEWEYLCRAGTETALHSGDLVQLHCHVDANLDAIGWFCGNSPAGPAEVGQKTANAAGYHDMSGNLREWCWDWYGDLSPEPAFDPIGPAEGDLKVARGGSWYVAGQDCRSAARGALPPDSADDTVGFRVVRTDFSK